MARRNGTLVKRQLAAKTPSGKARFVWDAAVSVGKGAERRKVWKHGFDTKAQADAWLLEAGGQAAKGTMVDKSNVTLGEFAAQWLQEKIDNDELKATTIQGYQSILKNHVSKIGGTPIQQVDVPQLTAFYAYLRKMKLSGATAHRVHTLLHTIFRAAVGKELVSRNIPAVVADADMAPKEKRAKVRFWQERDLRRFLRYVEDEGDDLRALWRLFAVTGVRRGEAIGLRWADVAIDADPARPAAGQVTIAQTIVVVNGKPQFDTPKSDAGGRVIALDARTVDALRGHRARQNADKLKAGAAWISRFKVGDDWVANDLVFTDALGNPLHPDRVGARFIRLVKAAGCPPLTLHGLRHTSASIALLNGASRLAVKERLGHATAEFTETMYGHLTDKGNAEAAAIQAAVIDGV